MHINSGTVYNNFSNFLLSSGLKYFQSEDLFRNYPHFFYMKTPFNNDHHFLSSLRLILKAVVPYDFIG